MNCPDCGTPNPSHATNCGNCGRQFFKKPKLGPPSQMSAPHASLTATTPCPYATQPAPQVTTVTPAVQWSEAAILFDRSYDQSFPLAGAPRPTATALTVSAAIVPPSAAYAGSGTLAVTQGSIALYSDAMCTNPVNLPATIGNAALLAGTTLYALGTQPGDATVQLTLAPALGVNVQGPASQTAEVVKLTLDAAEFAPGGTTLVEDQRVVRGKLVGLRPAQGVSQRAPVTPARTGNLGALVLTDASGQSGLALRAHEWNAGQDQLGQALTSGTTYWIEGVPIPAANVLPQAWLHLGLRLASGTLLDAGDCLRVKRVAHGANSVGYEWEVNDMALERVTKPCEGPPSKSRVYQCPRAGMGIDTEVDTSLNAFGEFVLGPARTFADVEAQILEVRKFWDVARYHGTVSVAVPNDIPNQSGVGFFMRSGHYCRVAGPTTGGTAQASFAVPLWLLPVYLVLHDAQDGAPAKLTAEQYAATDSAVDEAVIGLICACEYYILKYDGCQNITADDGPKVLAKVMIRSDFHSMYAALPAASQMAFQGWVNGHAKRANLLLPNGYSLGGGARENAGPSIGAWLDSIVAPVLPRTKDLMSPPPGFAGHHTNPLIPYAMGKYGLDGTTGNVITEYRDWYASISDAASFGKKALAWARANRVAGVQTWDDEGTPPGRILPRAGRVGTGTRDFQYT